MPNNSYPRNYGFAFILITLGVVLLLDQLGYADFGYLIGVFWPLILISFGLNAILKKSILSGGVLTGLGLMFLLDNLNIVSVNVFRFIWPFAIIFAGMVVLFRSNSKSHKWQGQESSKAGNWVSPSVLFGGRSDVFKIDPFVGGPVNVTFGGVELDLTQCNIKDKAVLNVHIAFGGLEITVPKDWKITKSITPIFGGLSDERKNLEEISDGKELIITGDVIFGGIDIKS